MTAAKLRKLCLSFPSVIEDFPFSPGVSVFRVAGKMFALSGLSRSPLEVSLKCEPDRAVDLRATYPCVQPGYHLNKRHWNTVTLDGSLPDEFLRDLIEDSYDLVASGLPQRIQREIGWSAAPE